MANLPVVGPVGAGLTKLSPKTKRILKRRAIHQARRKFNPDIRAAKAATRGLKHQMHSEIHGAKAASHYVASSLDSQIAAARQSGLKGKTLKQTIRELQSQKVDAVKEVPFQAQQVRQDYQSQMLAAQQGVLDAKAARAKGMEKAYSGMLDKAYTQAKNPIQKGGKTAASTAKQKAHQRAMNNAFITTRNLYLDAMKADPKPLTEDDWRELEGIVATKAEGADQTMAAAAIARFREALQAPYKKGAQVAATAGASAIARAVYGG